MIYEIIIEYDDDDDDDTNRHLIDKVVQLSLQSEANNRINTITNS